MTNGDIEHVIEVAAEPIENGIRVVGRYIGGSLKVETDSVVVNWPVRYECPNEFDPGHVAIGDGRIEIAIPELRCIGLGSLFMAFIVHWIRAKPCVPVDSILLKGDDALTVEAKESRNRFYEKFGFVFDYKEDRSWGSSRTMYSGQLREPCLKFPQGWDVTNV